MLEFSARKVGPKVYTRLSASQYASTLSWPETVSAACRPKKSWEKSTSPPGVFGTFTRSRVETRNISPAPSASLVVRMGVCTQKKPLRSKKRCTAIASVCRTRATAPKVFVRGRRCAMPRRNSIECCLGWMGYVSGSSTHPATSIDVARTSTGCGRSGVGTSSPRTTTEQPAVRRTISLS